ncbi:MAG: hypothetical protein ACYCZJ_08535 [Sulfuriferula sp.]
MNAMDIVVLETGIFPDRETLTQVVEHLQKTHHVWRFNATPTGNTDRDWDQALLRLLGADRIIVV